MIVYARHAGDETRESRLDAAISRGYDPHTPDDYSPARPLEGAWLAAFDASVAQAQALTTARAAS